MFNFLRHAVALWFAEAGSYFMNSAFKLLGCPKGTTLYAFGELHQSISDLCYVIAWEIDGKENGRTNCT